MKDDCIDSNKNGRSNVDTLLQEVSDNLNNLRFHCIKVLPYPLRQTSLLDAITVFFEVQILQSIDSTLAISLVSANSLEITPVIESVLRRAAGYPATTVDSFENLSPVAPNSDQLHLCMQSYNQIADLLPEYKSSILLRAATDFYSGIDVEFAERDAVAKIAATLLLIASE